MSDSLFDAINKPTEPPKTSNRPEFSVSELSYALKRSVEDAFSYVRVRGEISGFKRAGSGHLYMALKDNDAVIDGVCWRGTAQKLGLKPEDGMDVVVTGKLTTYPGRSKYQIVIDSMELAGVGALLKLLEERKTKLTSEGLFDPSRKQALPFLPKVIGVVTSPTGAVVRDILHRLNDRFPRHVLVWPVLVQGQGAAEQIAAAIDGFNALGAHNLITPKPDLLIVARGGGSLEDLWCFNEESVVRAAARSKIPLISAVGHETDTTLIDFASDQRAPTPTAAAEMAVPVKSDLISHMRELDHRLNQGVERALHQRTTYLEGLSRGLPQPHNLLDHATQRLDDVSGRLKPALGRNLEKRASIISLQSARLKRPDAFLDQQADRLQSLNERLELSGDNHIKRAHDRLEQAQLDRRLNRSFDQKLKSQSDLLDQLGQRLENLSYRSILKRGYAVIRNQDGALVASNKEAEKAQPALIEFHDGRYAIPSDGIQPAPKRHPKKLASDDRQGELL